METLKYYFTPSMEIGIFAGIKKQVDGERYALMVNGVEKRFRPDLLVQVPAEKLPTIKRLACRIIHL